MFVDEDAGELLGDCLEGLPSTVQFEFDCVLIDKVEVREVFGSVIEVFGECCSFSSHFGWFRDWLGNVFVNFRN